MLALAKNAGQGFHFIPEHDELGSLMRIENGPLGERVVKAIPKVIQTLLNLTLI